MLSPLAPCLNGRRRAVMLSSARNRLTAMESALLPPLGRRTETLFSARARASRAKTSSHCEKTRHLMDASDCFKSRICCTMAVILVLWLPLIRPWCSEGTTESPVVLSARRRVMNSTSATVAVARQYGQRRRWPCPLERRTMPQEEQTMWPHGAMHASLLRDSWHTPQVIFFSSVSAGAGPGASVPASPSACCCLDCLARLVRYTSCPLARRRVALASSPSALNCILRWSSSWGARRW
mmetsp:Transcript_42811/g.100706  ORF Transcript_42811/g.100706 Transcript_42811/m.100706 type:complete len:238 (+) Transcript_42811:429-1142(+)